MANTLNNTNRKENSKSWYKKVSIPLVRVVKDIFNPLILILIPSITPLTLHSLCHASDATPLMPRPWCHIPATVSLSFGPLLTGMF